MWNVFGNVTQLEWILASIGKIERNHTSQDHISNANKTKQNNGNGSSWWFNWWSIPTEYHATFNCLNKYVELNRTQTLRCQWRWQMFAFTIENYENRSSIVNSNQPSAIHSMHYFLLRSFNLRLNMLFQQHSTHISISIGWNWYSKWFVTFTLSTSPQSNHCECKIIVCFVTHSAFCISVISTKKTDTFETLANELKREKLYLFVNTEQLKYFSGIISVD